jgi:hypothetical protein
MREAGVSGLTGPTMLVVEEEVLMAAAAGPVGATAIGVRGPPAAGRLAV